MIRIPGEDLHLLRKWVEKLVYGDVLDMFTGTGLQAFAAAPKAKKVIAVDSNPEAIEYCKNAIHIFKNIEFRVSDLFSNVHEKFDFIIFNPPESRYDKETIVMFLKEAKKYLKQKGKILMIFSSLINPKKVLEIAKEIGYKFKLLEKKNISFEDLFIYEFYLNKIS